MTAFLWGGANVLPSNLRGTASDAFIHIADWYGTLCTLVGVDPTDDGYLSNGVPPVDSIDAWAVLMKPNASSADSARTELPLAFCPNTKESESVQSPIHRGGVQYSVHGAWCMVQCSTQYSPHCTPRPSVL